MAEERWLPVVGYEGFYEVSDAGRVRSVERFAKNRHGSITLKNGRPLALFHDKDGYHRVSLWKDGSTKQRPVHQLVLEAFVGPRPDGAMTLHADGTRTNNKCGNISWGTALQNAIDRGRHGRGMRGERNPKAKLTPDRVGDIRKSERPPRELAVLFGVDRKTIYDIKCGRTWSEVC